MSDPAAKPILIAHLGAHKTATSLIQKYFEEKKDHYRAQGLLFITRSEISPFISWGNNIIKEPGKMTDYIRKRMDKAGVSMALFSNENVLGRPFQKKPGLYPAHKNIVPALSGALSAFDTRIVYSIRPQWDFVQSYYLQRIHEGGHDTFNQFIAEIDLDTLSWRPLINALKREFGARKVSVLDFRTIKAGQSPFLQSFVADCVSPDITPDLDYADVHNASISDRGLHLALRINPLLNPGESRIVRRFLQENFSNLTEPRPNLMDAALLERLQARYGAEYEELVAKPA